MHRRAILIGGSLIAAAPFATLPAIAQDVDPEKLPMLQLGTVSKMMSEIAQGTVTNDDLRTFAGLEIAEVDAVVAAFGATGPAPLTEEQQARVDALRAAENPDMAYLDGEILAHEQILPVAQDYAASGSDPMARGGAMVAVPSIETHLAMLRGIRQTM